MAAVLLFRSGRHLGTAVAALRAAYPAERLVVVTQPGTDAELAAAGVAPADRVIFGKGRFSPLRFLFSEAGRRALRLRLTRVAVLWNDPDGCGLGNVTLTAAVIGGGRVIPVTPDGILARVTWRNVVRGWTAPLRHRLSLLATAWAALRARVEGPELESPLWHSHYLSLRLTERAMPGLTRDLTGTVLDIGAGTGFVGRFLDPARTRYLATDLPDGRDSRDAAITRKGSRPRAFCDGAALPFRDRSVDAVTGIYVLEHVVAPSTILREAYRVLRPGGRVLIVTPFAYPFHAEPADYHRWTDEGLAAELRAAGFEPEGTYRIGSSLSALVTHLHLTAKYEWAISRWIWPVMLPWQAVNNLCALWLARLEAAPRMPIAVAVVATRPR